jgi:hypothetical protein
LHSMPAIASVTVTSATLIASRKVIHKWRFDTTGMGR